MPGAHARNIDGDHLAQLERGRNLCEFLVRVHNFHGGERATRRAEVAGKSGERIQLADSSRNDRVESMAAKPVLEWLAYDFDVRQAEFAHRLPQESRFSVVTFNQRDCMLRPRKDKWDAGNTQAASDIRDRTWRQVRKHRHAVEQVIADRLIPVMTGSHMMDLVPLDD